MPKTTTETDEEKGRLVSFRINEAVLLASFVVTAQSWLLRQVPIQAIFRGTVYTVHDSLAHYGLVTDPKDLASYINFLLAVFTVLTIYRKAWQSKREDDRKAVYGLRE